MCDLARLFVCVSVSLSLAVCVYRSRYAKPQEKLQFSVQIKLNSIFEMALLHLVFFVVFFFFCFVRFFLHFLPFIWLIKNEMKIWMNGFFFEFLNGYSRYSIKAESSNQFESNTCLTHLCCFCSVGAACVLSHVWRHLSLSFARFFAHLLANSPVHRFFVCIWTRLPMYIDLYVCVFACELKTTSDIWNK